MRLIDAVPFVLPYLIGAIVARMNEKTAATEGSTLEWLQSRSDAVSKR
jgi:hypothetical protein